MSPALLRSLAPAGSAASSRPLTRAVRRFALKRRILDHANERSSHTVPTPG